MLSAGPHSGLSRPASALAPGATTSGPGFTHLQQQQQRRLLSIQSDDHQASTEELGAAEEGAVGEAAEETVEEAEAKVEEPAANQIEPLYLLQADGIPFSMQQEEIEHWFADAGCGSVKVTVPLWPEGSMRAGQNKGKAYLHFENEEDTHAGLALSGRSMLERWISISRLVTPLEEVRRDIPLFVVF